jgi:hypothetical protein
MNIGFDLDKVFINFPPLVPSGVIDYLYKNKGAKKLSYRYPSRIEKIIRIFSHHPIFRSPIAENLNYVRKLNSKNNNKYYLVSSRFSFLKKRTDKLINKYDLDNVFNELFFNYSDIQPHEFKDKMIKKLKLDKFIDDDLPLLEYLTGKNPKTNFYWLNNLFSKKLKSNLFAIKHISEMFK